MIAIGLLFARMVRDDFFKPRLRLEAEILILRINSTSWSGERRAGHAADNFFAKEVAQKQATPFPRQDLLTARNCF